MTQIVKELRTFSRLDEAEKKVSNLGENIRSTLAIAKGHLKTRIKVELDVDHLPVIECYPAELNQVFLNIIINAAQAIITDHHQGKIDVKSTPGEGSIFTITLPKELPNGP